MKREAKLMDTHAREALFARFKTANPSPNTELLYDSAFELLIAVLLSAQATDISVNKATRGLFKAANTPEKMLALGLEKITAQIKSIGLYQTKAKNVLATCQILVNEHHSTVPENREALEALPGVGRKTANVVLNTFFGHPTMAVDTHIFRLSNRLGLAPGAHVLAVEQALLKRVPKTYLRDAHHWLILHGRYVCKARNPACDQCTVFDLCNWKLKTATAAQMAAQGD